MENQFVNNADNENLTIFLVFIVVSYLTFIMRLISDVTRTIVIQ